jgi:hypothetical protein
MRWFRYVQRRMLAYFCTSIYPLESIISKSSWCSSLFLGKRSKSKIWLDSLEVGEQLACLLVLDSRSDDNIVARDPL